MYRAKDVDTGKWVYGNLYTMMLGTFICAGEDFRDLKPYLVLLDTVQRKLFFQDKHGNEVYVGMQVRTFYDDGTPGMEGVIVDGGVCSSGLRNAVHDAVFPLYIFGSFEVTE